MLVIHVSYRCHAFHTAQNTSRTQLFKISPRVRISREDNNYKNKSCQVYSVTVPHPTRRPYSSLFFLQAFQAIQLLFFLQAVIAQCNTKATTNESPCQGEAMSS